MKLTAAFACGVGMGPPGGGGQGSALRPPQAPAAAQQHVHGVPRQAHEATAGEGRQATGAAGEEVGAPARHGNGGGGGCLREGTGKRTDCLSGGEL